MVEDTEVRFNAVRYEQTVRMLEEMIANERKWFEEKFDSIGHAVKSDFMFAHAHCSTGDFNSRAIRLGVLNELLGAMKR